jgi:CHAT domain-containing protein
MFVVLAFGLPGTVALHAQQVDCDIAVSQQQKARTRLGAVRGAPARETVPIISMDMVAGRLAEQIAIGKLPEHSALLLYAPDPGHGFRICLVGPAGLMAATLTQTDAQGLLKAIDALRWSYGVEELQQVRAARRSGQPPVQPPAMLSTPGEAERALGQILLPPPIADKLQKVKHLIIVPAGPIGTVPFPALSPFGKKGALVDHMSITLAPSLVEFTDTKGGWNATSAFATPLVVGDPLLVPSEEWVIPPLPGAQAEAQQVAAQLKADALTGVAARREAVANRATAASLIYVAAHGSADPQSPLDGGLLMLAGPTLEQGWWTARQIQSTRLSAELAVLSACQTGLGQQHDGGTIGLARAFQLAGVRRVVMSLWSIDDEATQMLMTRFVDHAGKAPPAEALRLAMLDARKKYPDPALWASFLAFGSAR